MDSLTVAALLNKLSAMAAATARVAAGAGAIGPAAAATGGAPRGLRTAAAVGAVIASHQQQQQPQQHQQAGHQQRLPPVQAMPASHSGYYAGSAPPAAFHQRAPVNLAAAAAIPGPVPSHAAVRWQFASSMQRSHARRGTAAAPPVHRRYATSAAVAEVDTSYDGCDPVGVGSLLEFERRKEYLLGRAIKRLAQGWQVEVPSGTVYSVKAEEVKFVLPGGSAYTSTDLRSIAAAAEEQARQDLLAVTWELSHEHGEIYTVPGMADFLFRSVDPAACAAALRMLRNDRLYFKQAGRSPPMFSPRSVADVHSMQGLLRQQAEAEAEWARFAADIEAAQLQPRPAKPGEQAWRAGPHGPRLQAVQALALGNLPPVGEQYQLASTTLANLGKTPSSQDAAYLLQSIGWWQPHLQLNLISAGITEHFPAELEAAAQQLLAAPPPDADAALRRDFTEAHEVYTIDDASTTEIDDGVSLERLPDGSTKVWVHIADPSRWVAPGTPLAEEALARSKSMYLPTGVIPMFPRALAEGPFSLRAGVRTEAMSVGARLSPEGALLADSVEVVPSRVQPTRRLTYVDVDEIFQECSEEEEADLFGLLRIAELRRHHRLFSGATEIAMPESSVVVEGSHLEEPSVSITEESQWDSPARQMVAEMMILAGEAVGELGRRLGVPLPYRGQAEPVLPDEAELAAVPPGPCQAVLLRQRMTRSMTVTAAPVRHAGLGLEAYVQFTSPIRRYGDLLAHWQLKAAVRGEQPPWAADPLSDVMDSVAANTQRLSKLERETESYWVAEYFRQVTQSRPRATWCATFLCWLKQEAGLGRVLVDGLGLETVVRINTPTQPGKLLYVRCTHVDVPMGMWRLDTVPSNQVSSDDLLH